MRKFWLENAVGERMAFQYAAQFLWEPQGLGVDENASNYEVSYGFFAQAAQEYGQPNISGTVVFFRDYGEPYANYSKLVQWMESAGELHLVYSPYNGREMYMDVALKSIELSEKTMYGGLECPITLLGLSPYYNQNPKVYTFAGAETENAMKFTFQFPFRFALSSAAGEQVFTVSGNFDAALEMEMNGPLSSPVLTVTDANTGAEYGELDLSGTSISAGQQIVYSSRPNHMGVWIVSQGTETSIEGDLDISKNNFITIPAGATCRAQFSATIPPGTAEVQQVLRVFEYFKG